MGRITASRTQLKPDPKFNSVLASKFINCLMWDGKKSRRPERLLRRPGGDRQEGEGRGADRGLHPGHQQRETARRGPLQAGRRRLVPGAHAGQSSRQQSLAFRWILMAVREKKGRPTSQKLAERIDRRLQ
jgi:small subunit ribosomal protein S7